MDLQPLPAPNVGSERRRTCATAILFALVVLFAALDLIADLAEGTTWLHASVEAALVLVGGVGLAVVLGRLAEIPRLTRRLVQVQAEAERWRSEAKDLLSGLGAAIERQLVRWELTSAEREIALLLLKGLSHKQIADLRQVSEGTVRQQSRAVYKKAGVEGRHDLAAFFLEGLMMPG